MKLLITGAWEQAKALMPRIEAMGHQAIYMQQEKDALPCAPEWAEGVICNGLFLYYPIEAFTSLKYIQLISAGYDRVPMEYIREHGIEIHNSKDVYSIPMAEHAVACALWFYRGLGGFRENQKAHVWEKRRNLKEIHGKAVLIVGCGNVGTACARAFRALGCTVAGIDQWITSAEGFSTIQKRESLIDCLRQADIVVLSVPLTKETKHLIADDELSSMKDEALLINISRGGVLDTVSLMKHLPRLCGAALDVFEEEPLPKDHPVWDCEKILITPHNSFVGDGNADRLMQSILENLRNR